MVTFGIDQMASHPAGFSQGFDFCKDRLCVGFGLLGVNLGRVGEHFGFERKHMKRLVDRECRHLCADRFGKIEPLLDRRGGERRPIGRDQNMLVHDASPFMSLPLGGDWQKGDAFALR